MATSRPDNLLSTEIVPVRCPQCGEAQNTVNGATDPLGANARIGCMVCGYAFSAFEYRDLLDARTRELSALRIASKQ